jgi:hypothetical protein
MTRQAGRPTVSPTGRGLSPDILHRRCRCRRASTKASFVVIISTEFVAEELPVWGTPSLQFLIQGRQPFAAKRTTYSHVANRHIHRTPMNHGPGANYHSDVSWKAVARIIDFQPKIASYPLPHSRQNCRHRFPSLRSITFERPPAGLSDPDAADSSPASLNLALCSCESGVDEARQRLACNAVSGDGCVGSTERNAGKK